MLGSLAFIFILLNFNFRIKVKVIKLLIILIFFHIFIVFNHKLSTNSFSCLNFIFEYLYTNYSTWFIWIWVGLFVLELIIYHFLLCFTFFYIIFIINFYFTKLFIVLILNFRMIKFMIVFKVFFWWLFSTNYNFFFHNLKHL